MDEIKKIRVELLSKEMVQNQWAKTVKIKSDANEIRKTDEVLWSMSYLHIFSFLLCFSFTLAL